jgi:Tol biopolymer transport system component
MNNGWPDHSPDGKKIVYQADDGHDIELYTINVGGGGRFQVTDNNKDDEFPDCSPDGEKIAYEATDGRNDEEIYTVDAGGGGEFNVTDNNTPDYGPSWGSR